MQIQGIEHDISDNVAYGINYKKKSINYLFLIVSKN